MQELSCLVMHLPLTIAYTKIGTARPVKKEQRLRLALISSMGFGARADVEPASRSKAISYHNRPLESGRSLKRRKRSEPAKESIKKLSRNSACYTEHED